MPPSIASDKEVKYDYPIVYVRVPRPYPKIYSGINHLNQAGLHQTNAPGAELRLLHPDGRDESLVPVEPHESITDPVVSFDAKRLDGFHNDDIPSPPLDLEDEKNVLDWCHHGKRRMYDVDYKGNVLPPRDAVAGKAMGPDGKLVKVAPLSDEDKLTLARWIDIGCPIDRNPPSPSGSGAGGEGWLLDEGRPTLTLTYPQANANTRFDRILIGMHDYGTGLDMPTFKVTADFAVDGVKAGENLGTRFKSIAPGVWELRLADPPKSLAHAKLQVEVRDRQGNTARIDRVFSVSAKGR